MNEAEIPRQGPGESWSVWRVLLIGQVLANAVLWISICLVLPLPSQWIWGDVLFFAPMVWQCEILGFWAGLGRSRWNVVVSVAATSAIAWMGCYFAADGNGWIEFQIFCFGLFSVVALTTGLLRRFAGSLQRVDEAMSETEALRFGIGQVLIWTALLAVVFGVVRVLFQFGLRSGGIRGNLEIFALAGCMSVCTVAAVWAILGTRVLPSRIAGMLLVTGFTVTLTQIFSGELLFTISAVFSQILVWLTLALLRQDRYRFLSRRED